MIFPSESPVKDEVVVNDRWGSGTSCHHGGFYNCHDRYMPGTLQAHKWENAMTIDKHSWGYRRDAALHDFKTTEEIIATLAQTVSCGGNLLINIGPTKDGKIIPLFEERLLQLGDWLKTNGEAIYESSPWAHQNDSFAHDVWYTAKEGGKSVYAIVLHYPVHGSALELAAVDGTKVKAVHLLGHKDELKFEGKSGSSSSSAHHTVVHFPQLSPRMVHIKYAYVFKFEFH